jgi:hypothetical protein
LGFVGSLLLGVAANDASCVVASFEEVAVNVLLACRIFQKYQIIPPFKKLKRATAIKAVALKN